MAKPRKKVLNLLYVLKSFQSTFRDFLKNLNSLFKKTKSSDKKLRKPSLPLSLFKAFYGRFLFSAFLKLVKDISTFISPILLEYQAFFTTRNLNL